MDGFVHFLHQVIRGGSMFKRSINGPSLRATMDRGSRGEAKTRPRSIRPFICHRPPNLLTDQHRRQSAQEETRERGVVSGGWRGGAAIQVIRATTAVAGRRTTEGAAAQTSFVPCCRLSRLASAISMGNDVMVVIIHPSHPIPIYVFVVGENKSIGSKRATCSVWSNKHSALFFCPL